MRSNQTVNSISDSSTIISRVESLLEQMTLAEKIGQMTQVEKNSITPEAVREHAIGSVLSGGGGNPTPNSPQTWAQMVRGFQDAALESRLRIPLIYGVDAVHGHSNVHGAVIFPHNIGLGATRDADLVERIGQITALELLATSVHWTFAPAVSVPQDIRWGRTYEGYSEDTGIVTELGLALVRGLQARRDDGSWVLPSIKHFVADGGTTWGTTNPVTWMPGGNWQAATPHWKIDQGDAQFDEATMRAVHLPPYKAAVEAGALNVMVSFSSWNGTKMHNNHYLLKDVLKGEFGFEGFVISDWMAVDQLDPDYYTSVVKAINAGLDMVMVPYDYVRFIDAMTKAVQTGDITEARIDDAVRRILRVKFELGLFERPFGDDDLLPEVGSGVHREVAREAVRKSLVLLKNDGVLPLESSADIIVAGPAADDIGRQCGGWTIEWQGDCGPTTDGSSILDGIKRQIGEPAIVHFEANGAFPADLKVGTGIAVVGETPYAEGAGDRGDPALTQDDIALLKRMRQHCDKLVLVVISGRPIVITDALPLVDAVVAAWLPGTEGVAVADVLYGEHPFTGKLAYTWPRSLDQLPRPEQTEAGPLFPLGFGLTT
jgi:beta-glucosidase